MPTKPHKRLKLLFADDERSLQELMSLELPRLGHEVTVCPDGAVAVAAGGGAKSPDDVIAAHCGACHNAGVLGAPKVGDTAAWKARADAKGGLDGILKSAIAGINAMPPKGTCATCSDDELLGAIKKMSGL